MGFAVRQEEAADLDGKEQEQPIAAQLELLQDVQLKGQAITGAMLCAALKVDIASGLPLRQVYLEKYLTNATAISSAQLMQMVLSLRNAMVSSLARDPDIFLSYAHSAAICVRALHRQQGR